MDKDLEALDIKELKKLRNKVEAAISSYQERKLSEARRLVDQELQKMGFKLKDIVDQPSKSKRAPAATKYAHPENPDLTWSGRGRRPDWVNQHLEQGLPLDDLLIKP